NRWAKCHVFTDCHGFGRGGPFAFLSSQRHISFPWKQTQRVNDGQRCCLPLQLHPGVLPAAMPKTCRSYRLRNLIRTNGRRWFDDNRLEGSMRDCSTLIARFGVGLKRARPLQGQALCSCSNSCREVEASRCEPRNKCRCSSGG